MKGCRFLLILVVATFGAKADSSGNLVAITYSNTPIPLAEQLAPMWSAPSELSTPSEPHGLAVTPRSVGAFRYDMAHDVKATRAFIHKQAVRASRYDAWLVLLAGLGLVVLQLRRTHKSLPHRSIIAY
jgi:hypothetical protein